MLKILEMQAKAVESQGSLQLSQMSLKERVQYKKSLKSQLGEDRSSPQAIGELDSPLPPENKILNINRNPPLRPRNSQCPELSAGSE